jgi:hypothetical protein
LRVNWQKRERRIKERNITLEIELDLELKALENKQRREFQTRLHRKEDVKTEARGESRGMAVAHPMSMRTDITMDYKEYQDSWGQQTDGVVERLGMLGMRRSRSC